MIEGGFVDRLKISRRDLVFGSAPRPVVCRRGLVIGGGDVYPEINFTLPSMDMGAAGVRAAVREHYREMIEGVCQRAVELEAPGLVVEYELLPPMTLEPEWGAEITRLLSGTMDAFHGKHGLCSALRVTPVDVRDSSRPPRMRTGEFAEKVLRSFELCGRAGGELLSIESTGGKELHDEALLAGDVAGIVYALGVLAPRDMAWLWGNVVRIARETGTIAAGDTACGFANTAMVLADKGMIPRVLAAVVRVASTARSLEAYRQGAVGPSKDCAYEGPFIKAMTGVPISMEGKSSSCAHLSVLGNIAGACCDLWSNESVQNVRLLSGPAPVASVEQLIYDCRLMNAATAEGAEGARRLQHWFVESDARRDPQAYVLQPDVVSRLAGAMEQEKSPLAMTLRAVDETLAVLREAAAAGELKFSATEERWLGMIEAQREGLPEDEEMLLELVKATRPELPFVPSEYGLS